jgi:hypothetical protein
MKYTIRPSEDRRYVLLKIEGNFTAREMMACVVESHSVGKELGVRNYLVDVRKAKNVDTALGNREFAYSDMKQTEGVDPHARVAGLVSPGDHSHDFVATVSANAGMSLKLFTDFDEAICYLCGKYPSGQ